MSNIEEYKGVIAMCTGVVNEAGNLEPMSLDNIKRNKSSLRHSAQPEAEHVAMEVIVEQKRDDKLANAEGITTFDSHATGENVMQYLTKPKGNRILRDGRVINPKGETIRYWKDELLEEGVESIEI